MKRIIFGGFLGVVVAVGILAFIGYQASEKAIVNAGKSLDTFQSAVSDLRNFNPQGAKEKLSDVQNDFDAARFDTIGNRFLPFLKTGIGVFSGIQKLTAQAVVLAGDISFLQERLLDLVLNQKGDELIARLEKVQGTLVEINQESVKMSSAAGGLQKLLSIHPGFFLPLQVDLTRSEEFLGSFLSWFRSETPRHIVILLQNPSEMRPAGGFLGSYAEAVMRRGNIETVDVHDINEVDRGSTRNIVPPEPLQAIMTRWKTADANWFFDFSDSAQKVIEFMESSSLYKNRGITFDGAVALSPKVVGDLLKLTGPIDLKEYRLTVDASNFLVEIQKQVQLGQEKKSTYPKQVLEKLAPALLSKLATLPDSEKQQIFPLIQNWLEKKDAMAYFKDARFEKFFDEYGWAGKPYELPQEFQGDYLALVDSNIGGGKTDLFVKQKVILQSQINIDGTVSNHLIVGRDHQGNKSASWWYKVQNQDYLKVFTPKGGRLTTFQGGVKKEINPPLKYKQNGYENDKLVEEIESTKKEFFSYPALKAYEEEGKNVFATWSKVDPGKSTQMTFDYTHRLFLPPTEGQLYQFVFEKQAGSEREYRFEFSAPVGYRFRDNKLPIFEYATSDPPGRLVLDMTLEKFNAE